MQHEICAIRSSNVSEILFSFPITSEGRVFGDVMDASLANRALVEAPVHFENLIRVEGFGEGRRSGVRKSAMQPLNPFATTQPRNRGGPL